jgi:hypothetical protein
MTPRKSLKRIFAVMAAWRVIPPAAAQRFAGKSAAGFERIAHAKAR